ncbi:MAG TPA: DEAD/DEAH box helicase [Chthoniobacterales bacterium]|jgi:ATP-dependent Lhr-like helicase
MLTPAPDGLDPFAILSQEVGGWFRGKYGAFTHAQTLCIPAIHEGKSILLSSPTGSGKTLAGFLGIIDRLVGMAPKERGVGLFAIYISPLRALAYDIQKNLTEPLHEMELEEEIRVGLRTGDTTANERAKQRRKPPHILITTPESLAILLCSAPFRDALRSCRYVIIDEVHAIAENKRGTHLSLTLERLETLVDHPLCRIGLSATVAPLDLVARFLAGVDRPCLIAEAKAVRRVEVEVFSPLRKQPYPPAGWTAGRLVTELAVLVSQQRSVLIFTNTRSGAETVGIRLKQSLPEIADQIETHHSSIDREMRLEVEDRLKRGELRAVVCSTSLEMGIDIGAIDLVIMISTPKGISRALQRIGRSGHSVHDVSRGVLVATNINDLVECIVTSDLVKQRRLDPVRIFENCYDVLAQHIVGIALTAPISVEDLLTLVRRSWPYRHLTDEEMESVLIYLAGGGRSLQKQYEETFGKIRLINGMVHALDSKRAEREYLVNVGTIAADGNINVMLGRKRLGTVDEWFIKRLRIGDVFVLGARIVRLVDTGIQEAKVEAADHEMPTVPSWNQNKMPLTSGIAREVTHLRTILNSQLSAAGAEPSVTTDWLVEHYDLSSSNAQAVVNHFLTQLRISSIPVERLMLIELYREENLSHYIFHSLIGRSANDALSRLLVKRINKLIGGNGLVTIDDYGFLVTLRRFQELSVEQWRLLFYRENAEVELQEALKDSELVKWQFRGVAQTGLMVPRNHPGQERRLKQLRWSSEILFRVLQEHEPDHPLIAETYRQAEQVFLDAPAAFAYLEEVQDYEWRLVETAKISPFAFGIYVSKIKESMMMENPEAAIERLFNEMYGEASDEESVSI